MHRFVLAFLLGISLLSAQSDDCPALLKEPGRERFLGAQRRQAIQGWDKLLTWALTPQYIPYKPILPYQEKRQTVELKTLLEFPGNYGYFSIYEPIVGMVTEDPRDLRVAQCLLEEVHERLLDRDQLTFTTEEILAKVIAYRNLEKGMRISLSTAKETYVTFVVDEVIDLWGGMPAFGLVPERKNGVAPILLFRGTDLNLDSAKSWASVLSDLDPNGPGHTTFLNSRSKIRAWLTKAKEEYGPARAVGFSLGGCFVYYTLIYETGLLSQHATSFAFNPPGVSKETLNRWTGISAKDRPPHITYVNQGDFVSQVGFMLGPIWEVELKESMGVIAAHVTFISGQPFYLLRAIDVDALNEDRWK